MLKAFTHSQHYRAGETIFRKGDPGLSMMTIVDGRIKISVASPDGKEAAIAVLGPGEMVGELGVLEDKNRSANATALDPCEVLILQKSDLDTILERNPAICIRLMRIMSGRRKRTSARVS